MTNIPRIGGLMKEWKNESVRNGGDELMSGWIDKSANKKKRIKNVGKLLTRLAINEK